MCCGGGSGGKSSASWRSLTLILALPVLNILRQFRPGYRDGPGSERIFVPRLFQQNNMADSRDTFTFTSLG